MMIIGLDDDLGWALLLGRPAPAADADDHADDDRTDEPGGTEGRRRGVREFPVADRRRKPERRRAASDRSGNRDRRRSPVVSLEADPTTTD